MTDDKATGAKAAAGPDPDGTIADETLPVTAPAPAPTPGDVLAGRPFSFDMLVALAFLAMMTLLTYKPFSPILTAMVWGALLAIVAAHPFERVVSHIGGRRSLAAVIFAVIFAVLLLLPAVLFVLELLQWVPALESLPDSLSKGMIPEIAAKLAEQPALGPKVQEWLLRAATEFEDQIAALVLNMGGVATWVIGRFGALGGFLFQFILGGIIALFLLRYQFPVMSFLSRLTQRIGGGFAQIMLIQSFQTTRGAFVGVVVAAIVQTILAVLALVVAGVPGIPILAALTFLLALVQIGPLVIMILAAGFLALQQSYLPAGLMVFWFLGVVMMIDNLIKPWFAARSDVVPAFLTFLGAIGGILSFGLIGVFVGPVLISVVFRMLHAWLYHEPPKAAEPT